MPKVILIRKPDVCTCPATPPHAGEKNDCMIHKEWKDPWLTSFWLDEGKPRENKMRFCCYCGAILREKRPENDRNTD